MNISQILPVIRPGEQWSLSGTEYEGLNWLDVTPKPTLEELEEGAAILESLSYRSKRVREYPSIGDQLDALWKGGTAAADMLALVQAVKDKYPKP